MNNTISYYGFVGKGRQYAEVLVVKEQGQRSTQSETGTIYPSFRAAEKAVGDKNLTISRDRYGK